MFYSQTNMSTNLYRRTNVLNNQVSFRADDNTDNDIVLSDVVRSQMMSQITPTRGTNNDQQRNLSRASGTEQMQLSDVVRSQVMSQITPTRGTNNDQQKNLSRASGTEQMQLSDVVRSQVMSQITPTRVNNNNPQRNLSRVLGPQQELSRLKGDVNSSGSALAQFGGSQDSMRMLEAHNILNRKDYYYKHIEKNSHKKKHKKESIDSKLVGFVPGGFLVKPVYNGAKAVVSTAFGTVRGLATVGAVGLAGTAALVVMASGTTGEGEVFEVGINHGVPVSLPKVEIALRDMNGNSSVSTERIRTSTEIGLPNWGGVGETAREINREQQLYDQNVTNGDRNAVPYVIERGGRVAAEKGQEFVEENGDKVGQAGNSIVDGIQDKVRGVLGLPDPDELAQTENNSVQRLKSTEETVRLRQLLEERGVDTSVPEQEDSEKFKLVFQYPQWVGNTWNTVTNPIGSAYNATTNFAHDKICDVTPDMLRGTFGCSAELPVVQPTPSPTVTPTPEQQQSLRRTNPN